MSKEDRYDDASVWKSPCDQALAVSLEHAALLKDETDSSFAEKFRSPKFRPLSADE